jgi:hypothetical protein
VSPASPVYHPRSPGDSVLYGIVHDHVDTFRAQAAGLREGEGLPRFVEQAFREFLRCGWLAGGRNRSWAVLMQRTFGLDVLACPRCGGRLRLIAVIEQPAVIKRLLGHLGLPTELPVPRPARPPPEPVRLDEPAAGCEFDAFMPVS